MLFHRLPFTVKRACNMKPFLESLLNIKDMIFLDQFETGALLYAFSDAEFKLPIHDRLKQECVKCINELYI